MSKIRQVLKRGYGLRAADGYYSQDMQDEMDRALDQRSIALTPSPEPSGMAIQPLRQRSAMQLPSTGAGAGRGTVNPQIASMQNLPATGAGAGRGSVNPPVVDPNAAPTLPTGKPAGMNAFGDKSTFYSSFNPDQANHGGTDMVQWSRPGMSNGHPDASAMAAVNNLGQPGNSMFGAARPTGPMFNPLGDPNRGLKAAGSPYQMPTPDVGFSSHMMSGPANTAVPPGAGPSMAPKPPLSLRDGGSFGYGEGAIYHPYYTPMIQSGDMGTGGHSWYNDTDGVDMSGTNNSPEPHHPYPSRGAVRLRNGGQIGPEIHADLGGMWNTVKGAVGLPVETPEQHAAAVRAHMAQQDADLRARQAAAAGQQPATAPAPSGNIATTGQGALQRGYDATRKAIEQQTQFGPADLQSAPAGPPTNHLPSDVGHPENGYIPVDHPLAPNTIGGGVLGRVMPGLRMAQIGANALAHNLGNRLAQVRANTPGFDEAMEYSRRPFGAPPVPDDAIGAFPDALPATGAGAGRGVQPSPVQGEALAPKKVPGLRDGGELKTGRGGRVPGKGSGDKIPAKYEPGEFVVSNDMLAAQPGLEQHLKQLRAGVLAQKGMTPEQADAKALGKKGIHAYYGYDDASNLIEAAGPTNPDNINQLLAQEDVNTRNDNARARIAQRAAVRGTVPTQSSIPLYATQAGQVSPDPGVSNIVGQARQQQIGALQQNADAARAARAASAGAPVQTPAQVVGTPAPANQPFLDAQGNGVAGARDYAARGINKTYTDFGREVPKGLSGTALRSGANLLRRLPGLGMVAGAIPEGLDVAQTINNPKAQDGDTSTQLASGIGRFGGAGAGAAAGMELGLLGGPLAPITVPLGGILGGLAGYKGADSAIKGLRSTWGLDPRDPAQRLEQDSPMAVPPVTQPGAAGPDASGGIPVPPDAPQEPTKLGDVRNVDELNGTMEQFGRPKGSDKAGWTTVSTPTAKNAQALRDTQWQNQREADAQNSRADTARQLAFFHDLNHEHDKDHMYDGLGPVHRAAAMQRDSEIQAQREGNQLQANTSLQTTAMNNEAAMYGHKMTNAYNMANMAREQANKNRDFELEIERYKSGRDDADFEANTKAQEKLRDSLAAQIPTLPDGSPDKATAATYMAGMQEFANQRMNQLKAHIQLHPGDEGAKREYAAIQQRGAAMLPDDVKNQFMMGMKARGVINNTATSVLNPIGTSATASGGPVRYLRRQPGLLGNDYITDTNDVIPGRNIEKEGGLFGFGGRPTHYYDDLIRAGDQVNAGNAGKKSLRN